MSKLSKKSPDSHLYAFWQPATYKGLDFIEVRALNEAFALHYRRVGLGNQVRLVKQEDPLYETNEAVRQVAFHRFTQFYESLHAQIAPTRIQPVINISMRPLLDARLLPPEWRYAALRNFLPDELSQVVGQWRSYMDLVAEGGCEGYLKACLVYHMSRDAEGRYRMLHRRLDEMLHHVSQPAMIDPHLIHELYMLASPPQMTPPRWADWQDDPYTQRPAILEKEAQLLAAFEQMDDLNRRWHRLVEGRLNFGPYRVPSEYYTYHGNGLEALLDGLNRIVQAGYGLMLEIT